MLNQSDVVVSGGAKGVDLWAEEAALLRGLPKPLIFPVPRGTSRDQFRAAAMHRNKKIVESCDVLVAFWDGDSTGTAWTHATATARGKITDIISPYRFTGDDIAELSAHFRDFLYQARHCND